MAMAPHSTRNHCLTSLGSLVGKTIVGMLTDPIPVFTGGRGAIVGNLLNLLTVAGAVASAFCRRVPIFFLGKVHVGHMFFGRSFNFP
jgi:hypothetical protein